MPEQTEAQKSYYESRRERSVPKGIPADEAFWLPDHSEIHTLLGKTDPFNEFGAEWSIADLMLFVFPKKYREIQHDLATKLLELMLSKGGELSFMEVSEFVKQNNASKATVYNKIIPRLIDIGMMERHRKFPDKEKGPYKLELSQSFSNYVIKMGNEWRRKVATAKSKRKQS